MTTYRVVGPGMAGTAPMTTAAGWQPSMTVEVQKAIAYIREQDDFGPATKGTLIAMVRAVAEAAINDVESLAAADASERAS